MSTPYLFTYGLLRRQANHDMSKFLHQQAQFVSEAVYKGKLYRIDHYPGAVPSDEPSDQVVGDVFRIDNAAVFQKLDEFEGIGPTYPQPHEYVRHVGPVTCTDGKKISAWIYLYNWPISEAKQIKSGNFLTAT